jgi:hypothetical protein
MPVPNGETPAQGLRDWWASPPRSGWRRLIAPWEYRHLRAWAGIRVASGAILVGLGAVTLSFGGTNRETYEWTTAFLAAAAAQFAFASDERPTRGHTPGTLRKSP